MNEPILVVQKNADKTLNKIVIPKMCIEKFGRNYYMKVYEDKIVLVPIKKKEK